MAANISGGSQTQGPDVPPKPVNVKQVLVYLTHDQHAALLKLKEKLGVPVSETIRRAIDRYLKQMESRK
jgi:predicted DNA-binding protein